ncbi:MAG TPA: HlyD family efflux transporter periplasmic adaptor subunit, partial [Oscillospiraceae bacterium]|nr:HlyD family efflux transporter periplasmic adaptor subunit [Oscillospiraceae bacterium]
MPETNVPAPTESGAPVLQKPAGTKKKKKKNTRRRIITLAIVAVVVGAGIFGLVKLLGKKEEKVPLTDFVTRGSIQSTVTGQGVAQAKESKTITLAAGGTVQEVFVTDGQQVHVGDPLYRIDSSVAEEAVETAQKAVTSAENSLQDLLDAYQELTVKAPHGGKLLDVRDVSVGDDVSVGETLATLVDDSKLRLELYFSYGYESDISVGQAATVSIPATMATVPGTVEAINKVRRISPEGSVLFEVSILLDNPGTLTSEMGATAALRSASGESILPYEAGELAYYRSTDIVTKAGGEAEWVGPLMDYAQVSAGDSLLRMSEEDTAEQIETARNTLESAQENLDEAVENLANFNAVSPINGTVLSCSLTVGEEVESGRVAISIANTSVMIINAEIDERNISYVKSGMPVSIDQWGTPFFGTVESVSLEGSYSNGVSTFPAVIRVDNPDGALLSGSYITYSLVASQSDDCLLVPIQSVQYVNIEEDGTISDD